MRIKRTKLIVKIRAIVKKFKLITLNQKNDIECFNRISQNFQSIRKNLKIIRVFYNDNVNVYFKNQFIRFVKIIEN